MNVLQKTNWEVVNGGLSVFQCFISWFKIDCYGKIKWQQWFWRKQAQQKSPSTWLIYTQILLRSTAQGHEPDRPRQHYCQVVWVKGRDDFCRQIGRTWNVIADENWPKTVLILISSRLTSYLTWLCFITRSDNSPLNWSCDSLYERGRCFLRLWDEGDK